MEDNFISWLKERRDAALKKRDEASTHTGKAMCGSKAKTFADVISYITQHQLSVTKQQKSTKQYHYEINGKPCVLSEPIFHFIWTYGTGHTEFGAHETQTEFNARLIKASYERDPERQPKLKSKHQLDEYNPRNNS